jgi:16S rRNA (uracil1498-N3)-methyltransferase
MRIPRIFQNTALHPTSTLTLSHEAAHHLRNVLRFKIGDNLILFNGDGNEYPAKIIDIKHDVVKVDVLEGLQLNKESPLRIHLGQAISKGDRMDTTLQKATELGVTEITPLFSARSEVRLKGEREEKKKQHWQKVLISACEQCGRNRLPQLNPPMTLEAWLKDRKEHTKIMLEVQSKESLKKGSITSSIALLVGPEGGLDVKERLSAEQQGFISLAMGPRTLRTETAGMVAIALLQFMGGDL